MEIKAQANFLRIAPDKIRILSNLVKGKKIDAALAQLANSGKSASKPLILALKQAKNQAIQANIKDNAGELTVKTMQVNEGPKLKRRRIRQQGRATAILKRGSHITIVVTDNINQNLKIKNQNDKTEKVENVKK